MDKYEYLAGEEIPTSDQIWITEQAKLTYSPLGKALEKQSKTIQYQGERQIMQLKKDSKNNYLIQIKINLFFVFKIIFN